MPLESNFDLACPGRNTPEIYWGAPVAGDEPIPMISTNGVSVLL
jgi:hypothetical protein